MAQLNPYLNFKGITEEVFNFYKSVFGGEFAMVMRFKDTPYADQSAPEDLEKIMHIALPIKGNILMGSDATGDMCDTMVQGNNFSLAYSADSKAEVDELFAKLSEGGFVFMPVGDAFWGAYFAAFSDKYGVNWMLSYDPRYS